MKTTVELQDDLFRRAKAAAAMRGETLKVFISTALEARLVSVATHLPRSGWRRAFGRATEEQVAEVDAALVGEFDKIDFEAWR
jgi:hypothetical protein